MSRRESIERLISLALGFVATLAVCCGLLFACACEKDMPFCKVPFAPAAPQE